MGEPIRFDLSNSERIVDPPIIDLLLHDSDLRAYVGEFVPDPHVSRELKESVYIGDATTAARRVGELISELSSLLPGSAPVIKIAHAGRDNFDFFTVGGGLFQLHDSASSQFSFDVYAVLQVLSQEVQLEFIRQRRSGRVAG